MSKEVLPGSKQPSQQRCGSGDPVDHSIIHSFIQSFTQQIFMEHLYEVLGVLQGTRHIVVNKGDKDPCPQEFHTQGGLWLLMRVKGGWRP